MNEPPRRHGITIRIATEAGHQPNPAVFAVMASGAAAARNASIVSAHTAEEIICVVTVPGVTGPEAAAVALAVVAGTLTAGDPAMSPSLWKAGARRRAPVRRIRSAGAGHGRRCK
jgi:hypothetical protein